MRCKKTVFAEQVMVAEQVIVAERKLCFVEWVCVTSGHAH